MATLKSSDITRMFWLVCLSVFVLAAAEPSWKTKPIAQWTEEDAKQVLTNSPWARSITAGITRRLGEDERREGGDMGQPHGVGYDGVDPKGSGAKLPTSIPALLTEKRSARSLPRETTLMLRWESALPVRVAELKAHVVEPPTSPGAGYSIAVYGIPPAEVKGDPKSLGDPLKKLAVLRREGKKDVKPLSVEVFQREDGLVIAYLFPLSAEIATKDGRVEFDAQIGRFVIAQSFDLEQMAFQDKLEL